MDDIKIKFEGFSPPSFVKSYFSELLEQVREEAPVSANIRAYVHSTGQEFRGVIKITSHAGEFFSTASSRKLIDLGKKLRQRIRRRLDRWKAIRFSQESIRNLEFLNRSENSKEESYADNGP